MSVHGGGITGQAEAILLGGARALGGYDPALEQTLRDKGYMTRDPVRSNVRSTANAVPVVGSSSRSVKY